MSEISSGGDSMDVSGETTFGGSETETSEAVGTVSSEVNNASDLGIETGTPGVEGVLTGHEVSISSTETTHGMNQILETPTQQERAKSVRLKLNPLLTSVKGKRVVMIDDSIVRGTRAEKSR